MPPFELTLSNGVALIDHADANAVMRHKWSAVRPRSYVMTTTKQNGKWRGLSLHRFLLGAPAGLIVDHIDGNPLNNTRANLRLATARENGVNRKARNRGYFGVSKVAGGWKAMIFADGRGIYLGLHETAEIAAAAYNEAARAMWGEYATKNKVSEVPGVLDALISAKRADIARLQSDIALIGG